MVLPSVLQNNKLTCSRVAQHPAEGGMHAALTGFEEWPDSWDVATTCVRHFVKFFRGKTVYFSNHFHTVWLNFFREGERIWLFLNYHFSFDIPWIFGSKLYILHCKQFSINISFKNEWMNIHYTHSPRNL